MAKRHRIQKDDRNGNYFVRIQVGGTRKYFNLGPRLKEARRELARLEKRVTRGQEDFSDHPVGNAEVPAAAPADPAKDPLLSELVAAHLKWVSDNRGMLIFIVLLAVFFLTMRTRPTDLSSGELEAHITDGTPTVLEFYSNL